jgi:starch phosphorylase
LFLLGLDAAVVVRVRWVGLVPLVAIAKSERLTTVMELLEQGFFGPEDPEIHKEMARYLREEDPYLVCADFDAYVDAQDLAAATYADPDKWTKLAVRNIAGSGRFSSDRTILGYARDVWRLDRVPVELVALEEGPPITEAD